MANEGTDKAMERKYINDNLLIERYLRDELSPAEAAAFEEAYLGSGELLDDLEAAEKLQQGLRDVTVLEKSVARSPRSRRIPSIFFSPQYAMAASFLLVASLGVTGLLYQQAGELDGHTGAPGAVPAQIVPLVSVRGLPGGEPVNTIRLDSDTHTYVLMLDPGFEPYTHYRTSVFEAGAGSTGDPILEANHLTPGYEDMLALSIPAVVLEPGEFDIHIEGWREEWPPEHAFAPVDVLTLRVLRAD